MKAHTVGWGTAKYTYCGLDATDPNIRTRVDAEIIYEFDEPRPCKKCRRTERNGGPQTHNLRRLSKAGAELLQES